MLPVYCLTDDQIKIFSDFGVEEENILAAIRFDLDTDGNFGETLLVIDKKRKRLCRYDSNKKKYDEFELVMLVNPYIDNYCTSNALLAYAVKSPVLFSEDMSEKEFERTCENAAKEGKTEIIGFCTNACKGRLFAFVHIWERLNVGETVTEDDPIFEQFHAKCPKCGTVYEDQNRRICNNCVNRKGLLIRLLAYFKPFKLQLLTLVICLVITSLISLMSPILTGQLMYDQVVSVTDPNVFAEHEELILDSSGFFGKAKDFLTALVDKQYYYYTESEAGKFVLSDSSDGVSSYVYANEQTPADAERFDLVITKNKKEAENTVQITGRLHDESNVYGVVLVIVLLAILSLCVSIISNRANARMSTRVTKNMKTDIFEAMSNLSIAYFNKHPTGRLVTRVNYDAVKIKNFYTGGIPYLIVNVLNFIGLTIFLFSINVRLTLIVFIPIPLIICLFRFMLPKLWSSYSRQWRRSSSLNAMLGDVLGGARVVKAFAKEADETNRFSSYNEKLCKANLRTNLITVLLFPVVGLLIGITSQAIWGFGGITVMGGKMTYGQLATYIGYLGMIFGPLDFFSTFTNLITDTINSAQRMFEVLDTVPDITEAKDPHKPEKIEGNISFDRVCFHYTPNRPILNNITFDIKKGDHVGLVGHTGSGKSTVANLITRMYDVISGSVSIDGVNVKDISIDVLRKNISIVSQEVFIFGGTIADNIRYAKPDASMEEVIAAATAANAHDFIMRLPEGYETMVGIGSRSLSGGERQRISIARALLMSPSILILDEATAAMDNETEKQISSAIDKLIEGRTTISIAHRLSTLKNCNYIMAIEHGELVEMGTAEELLERKGVYYNLYTLQNEQMNRVMQGL